MCLMFLQCCLMLVKSVVSGFEKLLKDFERLLNDVSEDMSEDAMIWAMMRAEFFVLSMSFSAHLKNAHHRPYHLETPMSECPSCPNLRSVQMSGVPK